MEILKRQRVKLPDGSYMPKLGQGTWLMGEDDSSYEREINGLRHGIDLGMTLIDTAEMYAEGKAENIVGNAIRNVDREEVYLVSKVYPKNACKKHIYSSLERSLKLLETNYLDLYLLHWREDTDLSEMVYCMEDLKQKGKIKRWGVSNFDVADMEDLWKVPDGNQCSMNQILYNLGTRGIEYDLLHWQRERQIPFMAYSPVGRHIKSHADEGSTCLRGSKKTWDFSSSAASCLCLKAGRYGCHSKSGGSRAHRGKCGGKPYHPDGGRSGAAFQILSGANRKNRNGKILKESKSKRVCS